MLPTREKYPEKRVPLVTSQSQLSMAMFLKSEVKKRSKDCFFGRGSQFALQEFVGSKIIILFFDGFELDAQKVLYCVATVVK